MLNRLRRLFTRGENKTLRSEAGRAYEQVLQALEAFLSAASWMNTYLYVQAHPELLSDDALAMLDQAIAAAQAENNGDAVAFYTEHRDLLRRCREFGTETAFAEKLGITVAELQARAEDAGSSASASWITEANEAEQRYLQTFAPWITKANEAERKYIQKGDLGALNHAVDTWNSILKHSKFRDAPVRIRLVVLNDAGGTFLNRYKAQRRVGDLDRALELWSQAVAAAPVDSPYRPMYLNNLGYGLRELYTGTGRPEDLKRALTAWEQAAQCVSPDSPYRASILTNLGGGLRELYTRTGRVEYLQQALHAHKQAMETAPPNSPEQLAILNNLGNGLRELYTRTGQLEDLEQAITVWRQAVQATPPDSPDLSSRLSNLGFGLRDLYTLTGRLANLEDAITLWQHALQATPPDSIERPTYLTNLGLGLRDRYVRTGELENLEQAITVWQQALKATSHDAPARPLILTNLGLGLRDRYARTGWLANLEQAIMVWQQAIQATPPDSPTRPLILNNLGTGLYARYAHTGQLENLEQAITAVQQAVRITPPDSPDLPTRLSNLGLGLRDRYELLGQLEDLEQALHVYQQAVATTPTDSPDLPNHLINLGLGLSTKYEHTGQPDDLEQMLRVYQQAIVITPSDSPDRPRFLSNLGNGLQARYTHYRRPQDLEQAISVYQQAVDTSPPDSPDRPMVLTNLGGALRERYGLTQRVEDFKQARTYYAQACELGKLLAPKVVLTASQNWGRWACERAVWNEAVQAFDAGLATVEQLHRSHLRRSDQQTWLSAAQGLHTRTAYVLIRAGDSTRHRRAVEVAELGRARGLGETLARDRSDLSRIAHNHPEIYKRYHEAAAQVRQFEHTGRELNQFSESSPAYRPHQDLVTQIRAARVELDAAIDEIRTIPGYDSFLRPPTYAQIAAAARPGTPLVYLITTPQGSLALIAPDTGEPESLLLDGFTEADLGGLLIKRENGEVVGGYLPGQLQGGTALTAALATSLPRLGEALVAPLAARLRDLHATGVILISTGLLSLLPLHAASYKVDGQIRCLLDEFDVAYAPSARVLATAQDELKRRSTGAPRLAGVGDPTEDLRFAAPELESICNLLPPRASQPFYRQEATRAAIWAALPTSTIAHFSCHGSFAADPLDSALYLATGEQITLRELVTGNTTALANIRLVVLSACQTAITDFQRVPDESIGLPGGFLQAGVPAVVGTLWSVNDLSTALLMFRFYELHMQGDAAAGLAPQSQAQALRMAQRWLRDLTYRGLDDYYKQRRQMGTAMKLAIRELNIKRMPPDDRPYVDPIYWAAFTFNGAAEV
jgi:CHAT domain-containing protein/tetratricopeptide (TPR) repeat protein